MDDFSPTPELVPRLARYLRTNPLASDTEEGIGQWWLGIGPPELLKLPGALAWLVQAGIVSTVKAADGRVRYRRATIDAVTDARLDRLIAGCKP
jgi:hypothetical protein